MIDQRQKEISMSTVTSTTPIAAKNNTRQKVMLWTGYVLSALPALLLLSSGVNAMTKSQQVLDGTAHLGYSGETVPIIGILAFLCSVLYVIPRTAVLGAILLTGYLGGAVASHLRVGDPTFFAVIIGAMIWAGLYLRDERLRQLIPFQSRVNALPNVSD